MTVIRKNGEIIYGMGELINNGTLLYNLDGLYSISNQYSNNDQIFSNDHTFRYYFGNFYFDKDGYVTIGTSNMKFKLTQCNDKIFTGFLLEDLYSFQLLNEVDSKDKDHDQETIVQNVNEKCNLSSVSGGDNIIFTTKIENQWSEGDITYSQMTTTIFNNNTATITSLSFKSNIVLRDDTSFWNIIKIDGNQYSLPSYVKELLPGNSYNFGYISKSNIIPIFTII